jgi:putative nucleotidyltransferase with HDIG domain
MAMKSLSEVRRTVEDHARQLCGSLDYNHDFDHHVQFVARDAEQIARSEGANADVVWTAAMLHEIGMAQGREGHDERSARMGEDFLRQHGVEETAVQAVMAAIRDNDHDQVSGASVETKCLYDADNLQTVGPVGFARVFSDMLVVLDSLPRYEAMRRFKNNRCGDYKPKPVEGWLRKAIGSCKSSIGSIFRSSRK